MGTRNLKLTPMTDRIRDQFLLELRHLLPVVKVADSCMQWSWHCKRFFVFPENQKLCFVVDS